MISPWRIACIDHLRSHFPAHAEMVEEYIGANTSSIHFNRRNEMRNQTNRTAHQFFNNQWSIPCVQAAAALDPRYFDVSSVALCFNCIDAPAYTPVGGVVRTPYCNLVATLPREAA